MTDETLQGIADTFRDFLIQHGKHQNTIRSYSNDLRQFFSWCRSTFGNELNIRALTRSDVKDFRAFLLTRNASPASVNRKTAALRQFFEFTLAQGLTDINPAVDISGVAPDPKPPTVLLRKDALLLIRTAEKHSQALDATIILLLLHSGLRSSELCNLTIGNVHMTSREARLFIRGQRGKTTRFVFLSLRTKNALRHYMYQRGISILAKHLRKEPLFLTYEGAPLTQQAVDHTVKRMGRLIGMPDITPSMLRNTYALHQLQSGVPPETVALTMGLTSQKSIQRLKNSMDTDLEAE